jgi:hypothetical protein
LHLDLVRRRADQQRAVRFTAERFGKRLIIAAFVLAAENDP